MTAVGAEMAGVADQIAQQERLLRSRRAGRRPARDMRSPARPAVWGGGGAAACPHLSWPAAAACRCAARTWHLRSGRPTFAAIGVEVSLQGQTGRAACLHPCPRDRHPDPVHRGALDQAHGPAYQAVPQPISLEGPLRVRGYGAGKEISDWGASRVPLLPRCVVRDRGHPARDRWADWSSSAVSPPRPLLGRQGSDQGSRAGWRRSGGRRGREPSPAGSLLDALRVTSAGPCSRTRRARSSRPRA